MGKKLKIFGDGVDLNRLKAIAADDKNIEFLGRVDDETKAELYSRSLAFINPQEEDFGITAVEAMASGRPVIAFKSGGALETVIAGVTGEFFNEQTVDSLAEALNNFDRAKFSPEIIKQHAEKFSVANFKKEITKYIDEAWKNFKNN